MNSCAANECTSTPSLRKSNIASVRCKLFLRGRECGTEPPLYATANRPHRFRNFLLAPSDRFKSFQAHSRLVGYCVVLVAGSSVRTLKTPFATSFRRAVARDDSQSDGRRRREKK